ncbi:MAG: D-alanyl-D-alanine carboxypeptidase [Parvularculaceae bacterium]
MKAVLRSVLGHVLGVFLIVGFSTPALANSKYAALVMHADSGDILFDRYSTLSRRPASLTKLMTLYLLFEEIEAGRLSLTSDLKISARAAGQPPSKLGLSAGETIKVETAIEALVVKSANDVAVVVAEAISGSEWRFAQKMTQRARELGMRRTTFRNASGLPNSRQRTTARDLATLGQRLMQDFPQQFHYFGARSLEWNGKTYRTHNALVKSYDGATGLKTGYTRSSGFNLATSAERNGQRLIGVVLGGRTSRTRDAHMRKILDQAFASIEKKPMLVASLYRNRPTPHLKPTLLAQLQAEGRPVPTLADARGASSDSTGPETSDDALGILIAATESDDLNQFERARFAALVAPHDGYVGEGDIESLVSRASGWSVQIGAYSSKTLAQRELEAAAAKGGLDDQARSILPARDGEGAQIYRARFTGLSEPDARDICKGLKQKDLACFVVSEAPPK